DEPGLTDEPVYRSTISYLAAWRARNYGRMADYLSALVMAGTHGEAAQMVREGCSRFELTDFSIRRLDFVGAAACEVDIDLVVGGETKAGRMRWIRESDEGSAL